MTESLYGVAMAQDFDVPVEVLTPAEFGELWPAAVTDDLVGAVNFPTDGTVNPGDAALALAKGAKDRGARFVQGVTVTGFTRAADGVAGHRRRDRSGHARSRDRGAGRRAVDERTRAPRRRQRGAVPARARLVMTEPAEGAREESPFLRDLDGYLYIRHHRGSYVIGAFEPNGKPMDPDLVPTTGFVELGPDWDHFAPVLANARQRLPELETIGFSHYCGRPRVSRPTPRSSWASSPRCPACGSRPA
jgi:4-methylaminobutanoate oxidase (formaldehyde-forming)